MATSSIEVMTRIVEASTKFHALDWEKFSSSKSCHIEFRKLGKENSKSTFRKTTSGLAKWYRDKFQIVGNGSECCGEWENGGYYYMKWVSTFKNYN